MFIIGYFESAPINAVSCGYGLFKIDLLSFLDPKNMVINLHGQFF